MGLKSRCRQAVLHSFWRYQGRICLFVFSSFERPPAFLGFQALLPSLSTSLQPLLCHLIFLPLKFLSLSSNETCVYIEAHLDNLQWYSHLTILKLFKNLFFFFLSCKVTFTASGHQDMDNFAEPLFCLQHWPKAILYYFVNLRVPGLCKYYIHQSTIITCASGLQL